MRHHHRLHHHHSVSSVLPLLFPLLPVLVAGCSSADPNGREGSGGLSLTRDGNPSQQAPDDASVQTNDSTPDADLAPDVQTAMGGGELSGDASSGSQPSSPDSGCHDGKHDAGPLDGAAEDAAPDSAADASKPDSAADASKPDSGGGSSGTFWVYYNGVFNWGGDYSFAATASYQDTRGGPEEGPYDIAINVTAPYGGWQPYAGGTVPMWDFNDAGYNYLVFDLKPTVAGQTWTCQFHAVGDIAIGSGIDVNSYGPTPVAGQWGHYKIPLQVLGVYDNGEPTYSGVYKFFIQDQTGRSTNLFYADNVGFSM